MSPGPENIEYKKRLGECPRTVFEQEITLEYRSRVIDSAYCHPPAEFYGYYIAYFFRTGILLIVYIVQKLSINVMISAITNQGKIHFMFYRETMSAQKLIEFMGRIIRSNERKVFLILDNLRVHHSKALDDFLTENAAFIKLYYLPSYSPDLNPDEYLNRDLKSNLNNRPLGRTKGKIEAYAMDHMNNLSRDTDRVARLFQADSVRYAS